MAIDTVSVSVPVSLPKKDIDGMRANAENHMGDMTDEQIVSHLAGNILERYFHPEYFDLS